ncbi:DUF2878 domain-containing protein [Methylovorus glucosotrophus]|uniref:Transmembrane protein n=1 Tax=Methylovorus glucosotrophus (strain SIP3-4) TaxID=582744 RepID=C6XDC7_METGS|nr:DUF2878 domain-containing protein [Methylovorus glucosotrophus]ACT50552.1 conserved hypothetical protein [Methylovorus glucosotrophus SIP3-4]
MFLKVINFVLFQLGWMACVWGGAHGLPWLGVACTLPILYWHLRQALLPGQETRLLLLAMVMGGLFDQALLTLELVSYPASAWPAGLLPLWMLCLWLLFASTLNVSLRWLRGSMPLAAVFGLIGGPLAYLAASRIGAVTLASGYLPWLVLALAWAILTPLLLWLSIRFDAYAVAADQQHGWSHV